MVNEIKIVCISVEQTGNFLFYEDSQNGKENISLVESFHWNRIQNSSYIVNISASNQPILMILLNWGSS